MKFTTNKDVFLKSLQLTQNAINTKNTLPILSNILLEAGEKNIVITATDLDIAITTTIKIQPQLTGSITIPAKKFIDIIKEMPEADIYISVKRNNMVVIECEKCVFKIMGLPKDEFPQPPDFKDRDHITLPGKDLKKMLLMTGFAMSKDETRYVLNGILLVIKPSFIRTVATDGRRLAVSEHKIQLPKTQERKIIIPAKTVNELSRLLCDESEIEVFFSDNQIAFNINGTRIVSRLIEGEYPNYEQVFPKEVKDKIRIPKDRFLSALKRAALFTNPESVSVKMDFTKDKLVLLKTSPYLGEAREEIDIDYKGKDLSIGFNPDYLIDAAKVLDKEHVELELTDAEKPGVIRLGEEFVYVVLPMQAA